VPFSGDELTTVLTRLEGDDTDAAFLTGVGERLFTALFAGGVCTRYAESVGRVGDSGGLRFRLRLDPPDRAIRDEKLSGSEEALGACRPQPPTGHSFPTTDRGILAFSREGRLSEHCRHKSKRTGQCSARFGADRRDDGFDGHSPPPHCGQKVGCHQ
jgi:hypothetical protein